MQNQKESQKKIRALLFVVVFSMGFNLKLIYAKDETWEAVRRYNGSGPDALAHVEAVRSIYLQIRQDCYFL